MFIGILSLTLTYSVHSILQLCTAGARDSTWTTTGTSARPSWRTRRTTSSTWGRAPASLSSRPSASEVGVAKTKPNQTFYRLWSLEGKCGLSRGWEVSIVVRIGCKNSLGFRSTTKRLLTAICHLPQRSVPRNRNENYNQTFYRLWSLDTYPFAREGRRSRGWEVSIVIRIACKKSEFRIIKRLLTAICHICPCYGHFPLITCIYMPGRCGCSSCTLFSVHNSIFSCNASAQIP
jgi:hypothetical protein